MIGMRWTQATLAAVVLVSACGGARAEEPKPEPEAPRPEAAAATPAETSTANPPWWGGRNLLYLEFGYGSDSVERFDASFVTDLTSEVENEFELTDAERGRFVIGWTLPNERGRFTFTFEGVSEKGYRLDSIGSLLAVQGSDPPVPSDTLPWWSLTAEDGRVNSFRNPPTWDFNDDLDGDLTPDPDEVRYLGIDLAAASSGPADLGNKTQTYDLLYGREWGGRRIWGNWSAGLRHFEYSGNIPTGVWLISLGNAPPGYGFSDGLGNPILVFQQETKGTGPTGSGGINFGFWRRRLVLYAEARVAFMVQDLSTDSGEFLTYAYENTTDSFIPLPAHLQHSISKSTWHVHGEIGARVRILENTHLMLAFRRTSYMDSVLLPVTLIVPDNPQQASQPATAQFNSRDINTDSLTLGLSYQF